MAQGGRDNLSRGAGSCAGIAFLVAIALLSIGNAQAAPANEATATAPATATATVTTTAATASKCDRAKFRIILDVGHTVPNGDPPQPYADDTDFCCMLVAKPVMFDKGFRKLKLGNKTIAFYVLPRG